MVSTVRFLTLLFFSCRFLCNSWLIIRTSSGCAALSHRKNLQEALSRKVAVGHKPWQRWRHHSAATHHIHKCERGTRQMRKMWMQNAKIANSGVATQLWLCQTQIDDPLCSNWQRDPSGNIRSVVLTVSAQYWHFPTCEFLINRIILKC